MRFRQMEEKKDTEEQMLSFVGGLGMVALRDFGEKDFEMHVRLEAILIDTLKDAYQQHTLETAGFTTANKKTLRKKLKKKQKQ